MTARADPRTPDLFDGYTEIHPPPEPGASLAGLSSRIARDMSRALKECPDSREIVAARMAELLDEPTLSKAMLDAYTAESRETHTISAHRLVAFTLATGATWIFARLAEELGCVLAAGTEARALERGKLREQIERLQRRERALVRESRR